jgi:hypothetical protein
MEELDRELTPEMNTPGDLKSTISAIALDTKQMNLADPNKPLPVETSDDQESEQVVTPPDHHDTTAVEQSEMVTVSSTPIVDVDSTKPSADLHVETTTATPSRPRQQKYVIVGGKVMPISAVKKTESSVDLPPASDLQRSESPKQTKQTPHFAQIGPSHPPRKRFKRQSNVPKSEMTPDREELGWSTEGEEEPAVPRLVASPVEAPEIATEVFEIENVSQTTILDDAVPSVIAEHNEPPEEFPSSPALSSVERIETSSAIVGSVAAEAEAGMGIGDSCEAIDVLAKPSSTINLAPEGKPESAAIYTVKTSTKTDSTSARYEIVKGVVVRKVSAADSKGNVATAQKSDTTITSITSTPSTPSQPSSGQRRPLSKADLDVRFKHRLRAEITSSQVPPPRVNSDVVPGVAEKFGFCGDLADSNTIPKLIRENALWPGAPHYPGAIPVVVGRSQEEPTSDVSQFFNGKTEPINQPSVRQEPFDPFGKESEKSLKQMKENYPTVLDSHDSSALKHLLSSRPSCFCGTPCAKFDGIVPVYVCGMLRRAYILYLILLISVMFCHRKS